MPNAAHPVQRLIERIAFQLSEQVAVPDHVLDLFRDCLPQLSLIAIVLERYESPALPARDTRFLRRD